MVDVPKFGHIVLYQSRDTIGGAISDAPAIVTKVTNSTTVNLTIFPDLTSPPPTQPDVIFCADLNGSTTLLSSWKFLP